MRSASGGRCDALCMLSIMVVVTSSSFFCCVGCVAATAGASPVAAAFSVPPTLICSGRFFPSSAAKATRQCRLPLGIRRPLSVGDGPRRRASVAVAAASYDDDDGGRRLRSSRQNPQHRQSDREREPHPQPQRKQRRYLATCVPGLESVLASELSSLGACDVRPSGSAAVSFRSPPSPSSSSYEDYDNEYDIGLRALLWSRTSHRIMELLARTGETSNRRAVDRDDLYDFVRSKVDALSLLSDARGKLRTLSVSTISNGPLPQDLRHGHYTALTVKNALVDAVRDETSQREGGKGVRPDVELDDPDVPLVVALRGYDDGYGEAECDISLYRCLHSGSLHRRGYRLNDNDDDGRGREGPGGGRGGRGEGGRGGVRSALIHAAALKESLASGLLLHAGYDRLLASARAGEGPAVLLDPTCGSGTMLIEAALMAADVAPGLVRVRTSGGTGSHRMPPAVRWGEYLPGGNDRNDDSSGGNGGGETEALRQWKSLLTDASRRASRGLSWLRQSSSSGTVTILGNEINSRAAQLAGRNVEGAGVGLEEAIGVDVGDCADWDLGGGGGGADDDGDGRVVVPGRTMVVSNPPWGQRLDDDVESSWTALRTFLRRECDGAEAWVLSGDPTLTRHLKMRKSRSVPIKTGGLNLRWVQYKVFGRGEAGSKFEEERERRRRNAEHEEEEGPRRDVATWREGRANRYGDERDDGHSDRQRNRNAREKAEEAEEAEARSRSRRRGREETQEAVPAVAGEGRAPRRKRGEGGGSRSGGSRSRNGSGDGGGDGGDGGGGGGGGAWY